MNTHKFTPEVLREYDIRGDVDVTLGETDALALGRAFGTHIKRNGGGSVCVGYDGRESSPRFAKALIKGLCETGINVEDIGLGPTPMLYFAVKDHMADGGVMVTGSHNPGHMNGFKMTLQNGPVFGQQIKDLAEIAQKGDFEQGEGRVRTVDVSDTYIERLLRDMNITKEMKVAWDCGNGAAGAVLHQLVSKLPGEHILLYDTVDGTFPNHHPDPTVDKNVADLQRVVLEQNCDLGIAFDGDADRIGVIDNKGQIVRCDMLIAVYAKEVLEDLPGAPIIADVKCSNALFAAIKKMGGQPIMWKTGHSLIKSKMAETKAPLAGELSGHIFFAHKYYGFDDALYCAVRLLNMLSALKDDQKLTDLMSDMPRPVNTPELRIDIAESEKFTLVEKVKAYLKQNLPDQNMINETDGVRVTLENGWWLLRPSNTQAAIVARAEANNNEDLDQAKKNLQMALSAAGHTIDF